MKTTLSMSKHATYTNVYCISFYVFTAFVLAIFFAGCGNIENNNMDYGTSYSNNKNILDSDKFNNENAGILFFEFPDYCKIRTFNIFYDNVEYPIATQDTFIACVVPVGKITIKISYGGVEAKTPSSKLGNFKHKYVVINAQEMILKIDIKKNALNYLLFDKTKINTHTRNIFKQWKNRVFIHGCIDTIHNQVNNNSKQLSFTPELDELIAQDKWLWMISYNENLISDYKKMIHYTLYVLKNNYKEREEKNISPLLSADEIDTFVSLDGLLYCLVRKSESDNYEDKDLNFLIFDIFTFFDSKKIDIPKELFERIMIIFKNDQKS